MTERKLKKVVFITKPGSPLLNLVNDDNFEVVGIIEDAPRGTKTKPDNESSLEVFCVENDLEYFYYYGKDSKDLCIDWISLLDLDLMVVYLMSRLLPKSIFSIPQYGTINLHPAYLPHYRGPNPYFWEYYHFDLEPGATVHFIDEGEDTGDILNQKKIKVKKNIAPVDLKKKVINELGMELIRKTILELQNGTYKESKQLTKGEFIKSPMIDKNKYEEYIIENDFDKEHLLHFAIGTEPYLRNIAPFSNKVIQPLFWKIEGLSEEIKAKGITVDKSFLFISNGKATIQLKKYYGEGNKAKLVNFLSKLNVKI